MLRHTMTLAFVPHWLSGLAWLAAGLGLESDPVAFHSGGHISGSEAAPGG